MASSIESFSRNEVLTKQLQHDTQSSTSKAGSSVLHRSLHEQPLSVAHAEGIYIHLKDGRRILDATGGAAVACLGHQNKRVQDALFQQMDSIAYCHSLFFAVDAVEELARLLIDSTRGDMSRAFIIGSGSEANEAALKFARQYYIEKKPSEPARVNFISRRLSYHGTTLGALGAGGHAARRRLFEPLLNQNTFHVSPCFAYRPPEAGLTAVAIVKWLEDELENMFQRIGPQTVAAFIAEPVVGAALGCVASLPGYFEAMQRVCHRHGALVIMDEIMCGVGRVGPRPTERYPQPLHAYQDPSVGIVPDILTLGKGLGGGFLPVAAMLIRKEVIGVLNAGTGAFSHGQTYQGHPMACRAALEVQRIIRENDLVANVRDQGKLLGALLSARLLSHKHVGSVRGSGLFWGIEFVADQHTKRPFDPLDNVATKIHQLGLKPQFNISLYPGNGTVDGLSGDHILLAPPYTCTSSDIRMIVDVTVSVIETFFAYNIERLVPMS